MCYHMFQFLIISDNFTIILKLFFMSSFHVRMVLDGDMWCNRNLPYGILVEFILNKFKCVGCRTR
jgi:hypothetical protein